MSPFQWMSRLWWGKGRIEGLAEQLAVSTLGAVQLRLSPCIAGMSSHELRGYVRARATPVAARAVQEAGARHQIASRFQPQLLDQLLESITRRVQLDQATRLLAQRRRAA